MKLLKKLEENQTSLGGWGWFKGMEENRFITSLILTGFLKLDKLKIIDIVETKIDSDNENSYTPEICDKKSVLVYNIEDDE